MNFLSDQVKLAGPKVDGSWSVTFSVGEYERESLKELIGIPAETNLKVTVEMVGE